MCDEHALGMQKQVVKRHANPVRHGHLGIPRQARAVQFHIRRQRLSGEPCKVVVRGGAFQLAEQHAPDVIAVCMDTVVQSPRRGVDCQHQNKHILFHGISKKKDGQGDIEWVGGERTYLGGNSSRETDWAAGS
jgi:hypothetical protein